MSDLQQHDIKSFRDAVSRGDLTTVTQLLELPHVKEQVNAPIFAFGQRAAHIAAKQAPMLEALITAGADLTLKSEWENGPYTVLDNATEETARFLLSRGVTLTANAAARLGWIDELRQLLAADPALVHARGGDGQQPLHEAATVAIAAQYTLAERPEICILQRGRVPIETPDPVHRGTPLGWAVFGSVHRRARGGDYSAVVDRLVAAGADINGTRNGEPESLIAMAEGNPEVQATLRKHGAR